MTLERTDGAPANLETLKDPLEACFIMVMRGFAENDGYNALVMAAGLQWRDVALLRTISRYLRQIRVRYSQDYMWATLRKHAGIAAQIVTLFHTRFDPRLDITIAERGERQTALLAEIERQYADRLVRPRRRMVPLADG